LEAVKEWVKVLGSGLLALVLANPLCFCRAELAPKSPGEVPAQGGCCGEKPGQPAPESESPFLPCDCAMTQDWGSLLALEVLDKPAGVALSTVDGMKPSVRLIAMSAAPQPRAVDIHGPPLRLLHSVFLL